LLFVLGINFGLRISDLITLRAHQLYTDNWSVKKDFVLKEQKTSKQRQITINDAARKALTEYKRLNPELQPYDYIFMSRQGDNSHINRVQAYNILTDAARQVGIDANIGTHTLRKTFGYWNYKGNVPIEKLMNIFNHSSQAITLRYIGITQQDIADVYNNLNL
jgi:integrase